MGESWDQLGLKTTPRAKKTSKTNFLGPLLGAIWSPKSIKIHPKSDPKRHLIFDQFLNRCLDHFGLILGAKLAPNRSQNRSSKRSQKLSSIGSLLGPILIDFGLQLGSQEGGDEGGSNALFLLLGPRWPPEPSKRTLGPILLDFLTNVD